MALVGVTYLADVAQAILDAAEAGLAAATTGVPSPDHVFVSHGSPAGDNCCDDGQLTVHLEQVLHLTGQDDPAPQYGCQIEARPTFVVSLLRCITGQGDTPESVDPTTLDDDAQDLLTDLWALLTEFYDRILNCTLVPGQSNCRDAHIVSALPVGPEGGCAGWEIRVSITANDSGPTGS